jgi:mRNA interferase MazF
MTSKYGMYEFGSIILVPFPFTDLTSTKVRPALVVSRPDQSARDVIVCFITSQVKPGMRHALSLRRTATSGLKVPSLVRFDKIATLDRRIVLGELGCISSQALRKHRRAFFSVFGFRLDREGAIRTAARRPAAC